MDKSAAGAAVAEPDVVEKAKAENPRPLPPHAVVLLNDDDHTIDYVVETLQKVFGYTKEKCFTLTMGVHRNGRGIVWSGTKELAELKRDQIRSAGPDFYAARKLDRPLGVVVEPLPG